MMLKQYQDSSKITDKPIGKIRDEADRERKNGEITNIKGYNGGFEIKRDETNFNSISFINLPDGS
jgi:hypothetical protein